MDNETFRACQLAIRERINAIDSLQSRNSPQSDRAGLVQIGFAVRLLAGRYLKAPTWPGHEVTNEVRLLWELEWYTGYVQAVAEICKTAQIAVREKRLTLRSQLTRTPLTQAALDSWLNMDIDAAISEAIKGFLPRVLELRPAFDAWPDALGIPPGAADAQDIAAWAAGDGLASVEEALSLLKGAAPAIDTATPAPVVALQPIGDGPAKRGNRKPPWATVAMPYMKSLFTNGHYKSASVFYKALTQRAGESGSPFKLVNRELYCTEAGTTVSDGALGNVWAEIRAH